jgi:hypothetical protein
MSADVERCGLTGHWGNECPSTQDDINADQQARRDEACQGMIQRSPWRNLGATSPFDPPPPPYQGIAHTELATDLGAEPVVPEDSYSTTTSTEHDYDYETDLCKTCHLYDKDVRDGVQGRSCCSRCNRTNAREHNKWCKQKYNGIYECIHQCGFRGAFSEVGRHEPNCPMRISRKRGDSPSASSTMPRDGVRACPRTNGEF